MNKKQNTLENHGIKRNDWRCVGDLTPEELDKLSFKAGEKIKIQLDNKKNK